LLEKLTPCKGSAFALPRNWIAFIDLISLKDKFWNVTKVSEQDIKHGTQ
jgi:hypothetical protein